MDETISRLSQPVAELLGLKLLPSYAPTIAYSFGAFLGLQLLSPIVSPILFPRSYKVLPRKTRQQWDMKVVSTAHALVVIPLALRCIMSSQINGYLSSDRAFGVHPDALRLTAIASGYFIWDTLVESMRFDLPFVAHGASALSIFLFGFRPFVNYFVGPSLIFEFSTPFLNIHWFLDKLGKTGSTLQLVNGLLLLSSFFGVRVVYGGFVSYDLLTTVWRVRNQIPWWLASIYLIGNPVLNGLNYFWFWKMIAALKKRFDGSSEKKGKD